MYVRSRQLAVSVLSFSLPLAGLCFAQTTERVNVDSSGAQANNSSPTWENDSSISADGRYVAFTSYASNLVPGDTNNIQDIFVHDRLSGVTQRVSVDSFGIEGDNIDYHPAISADGRFVTFDSWSTNLVAGDTNANADVFVHDRQSGVTERVSVDSLGTQGNSPSSHPSISGDGRFVAFESTASNLVPGFTSGFEDVFVHDRQTGVTEIVSMSSLGLDGNGHSTHASISADGNYVAFHSHATNLANRLDVNGWRDIFVRDRQAGVTEIVSLDSFGMQANYQSLEPSISADGRYVAFDSAATNFEPWDTNGVADIFVHDRQSGVTELVSVNSLGGLANNGSYLPSISADGRSVAFQSHATNLVAGDTNGLEDIFAHDRWTGSDANSIFLTGPSTSPVLDTVDFSWHSAAGNSTYWLAYSLNTNGAVISGHSFDIGNPMTVLATGINSANGMGSFTSQPVPSGAANLTVYFEVAALDAGGVLYDSNVHAVTFF